MKTFRLFVGAKFAEIGIMNVHGCGVAGPDMVWRVIVIVPVVTSLSTRRVVVLSGSHQPTTTR